MVITRSSMSPIPKEKVVVKQHSKGKMKKTTLEVKFKKMSESNTTKRKKKKMSEGGSSKSYRSFKCDFDEKYSTTN